MRDLAWIDALADRAGPLASAARDFARWRGVGDLAKGPEGARILARLVHDFCFATDASDDDDARFVEGAGALLGVLLLERLGGRHASEGHRHRLLLGAHGSFDPFAAIDAALDAEAPSAEVARQIRAAEAEAKGDGPFARVVRLFEEELWDGRPHLRIEHRFELDVTLGDDIEVDLRRVAESTDGQSEDAVRKAARKIVSMLPGGEGDGRVVAWSEAEGRLLPRLVSEPFLAQLEAAPETRGRLFRRPLGHDVVLTLLLSYQDRSRYVRDDEVEAWGMGSTGAQVAGLRKLAARSQQARFARVDTAEGPVVIAQTGDGLDAARLLLPGLHEVLREQLELPIVAAVPHRDTLVACSATKPELVAAVRARAEDDRARAPHGISSALFEVTPRGVVPFEG